MVNKKPANQVKKTVSRLDSAVKPSAATLPFKVTRTKATERQIKKATALKQSIIAEVKSLVPDVLKRSMADSAARLLLVQMELAAESFDVVFKECRTESVDRTCSMLSGPFFTSGKYPIPKVRSTMLFPVVQLDLRVASSISDQPLGDGLLQIWYDTRACKGVVRVIPRSEVIKKKCTKFDFVPSPDFDGFPFPMDWGSDPSDSTIRIMSAYKSTGIACQSEYATLYLQDLDGEYGVPDELTSLVENFQELAEDRSSSIVHLFGTFEPIQYSAADVGKKCLFDIAGDWGSSGNAQVFYDIAKNGAVSFAFRDSLR